MRVVPVRLSDVLLNRVIMWGTSQNPEISKSEAIRQLVEIGLEKTAGK